MTQPSNNVVSIAAAADLLGQRFINFAGNYPTAGAAALGVSNVSVKSGDMVGVQVSGVVEVTAGGSISVGAAVKVGTSGKAIAQGGTDTIVGYALDEATGDNQSIRIKLA